MLNVNQISFSYSDKTTLSNITFSIQKGEHVCLIGESGCGKSTLLKAIYGLLDLDEGKVLWNDDQVLGPAYNLVPGHPKMKFLEQRVELMPPLTVAENIQKFLSRQEPEKNRKRLDELLSVIEMKPLENIKIKHLSGGQKQRVAIAQVLAKEPELLLLDEPFNFIDNHLKNSLRRSLFNYLRERNITCIYATHDSSDMLGFSEKTIVLKEGKLVAMDTPKKLYDNPPNFYTASLFGEVNLIERALFNKNEEGKILVYPNELIVSNDKGISLSVIKSYFEGNYYLIEAKTEEKKNLFFYSPKRLNPEEKVRINIKNEVLKYRKTIE